MNEKQLNDRLNFFIEFMSRNGFKCDEIHLIDFKFVDEIQIVSDGKTIHGNGSYSRKLNQIELKFQELNKMTKVLFHELSHAIDKVNKTKESRENFAEIWSQKVYLRFI